MDEGVPATESQVSDGGLSWGTPGEAAALPPGHRVERRQLTVLFCDLVDSTRLAANVDPEDWHEAMGLYRAAARAAIQRYSGYVAQFQGDGVIAYFGFPRSNENDPSRAVRAGLAIVEALEELSARTAELGVPLAVRVGIHTGLAVVETTGDDIVRETTAVGTPANVAARMQALAPPNRVLVSETVRRLTAGEFVTSELGVFELRGLHGPAHIHSVVAASGVRSRLKAAERLTPFVGRERELTGLLDLWTEVRSGAGRTALVVGESGIGKSRLALTFQQRITAQPHTWLECRATPYTTHAAFAPIVELIMRGLELEEGHSRDEKRARLRRRAERDGLDAPALEAIVSPLVGLGTEASPGSIDPEMRARTIQMFVQWTLALSRPQPVVLLVEDLHWCDPSTIEFLLRLVEQVHDARILVLLTARPDFESPWRDEGQPVLVPLARLPKTSTRELLQLAYSDALSRDAMDAIIDRADGIPLYVEELARMVAESLRQDADGSTTDPRRLDGLIPDSLHDLLMARLDRLGSAKEVAQLASVIGREVPLSLIERLSPSAGLADSIEQLVQAGILFRHDAGPHSMLLFKHALIRDAAYHSLLRATRRQHHLRIAEMLVSEFADVVATQPEVVARHYTEARRPTEASDFWARAGRRALESSAYPEALAYADEGLAIVDDIPSEAERCTAELGLQLVLGPSLMATRGYADPAMEKAYGRARDLCRRLGDPPALFPVMFGLWTFHCVCARHGEAAAIARDMTLLAERDCNESLLLEADVTSGITHFYVGELEPSRTRLERVMRLYNGERDADHYLAYGQDPRSAALAHLMLAQWTAGDVEAARGSAARAVQLSKELTHPFSIGYALSFTAWLERLRGDSGACLELAREAIEVCSRHRLAVFLAISEILEGSAMVSLGDHAAGLERLQAGCERFAGTASTLIFPFWHCLRAQALADCGRIDDGLAAIEESILAIERTGERQAEAEAYRVRASLRRAARRPGEEVEADLRRSLDVARSQNARSWQLRSAVDLARLLADTARREEGLAMLREARAACSAGGDETDAIAADALLGAARSRTGQTGSSSMRRAARSTDATRTFTR